MLALIAAGAWFFTHDSGGADTSQTAAHRQNNAGTGSQPNGTPTTPAETESPTAPVDTEPPTKPAETVAPERDAPLNVAAAFVNQPCSGALVVILASSGTPADYQSTIGGAVDAVPGAKYLRTDRSCATFNQSIDGNPIYAAYIGPFSSMDEACQARIQSGLAGSYVRTLALDRSLREICSCRDSLDTLPRLSVQTASHPSYDLRLRVVDLQSMLYSAGFNEANLITGSFGRQTTSMVRRFQHANGLAVDGWVGPETWAALLSSECP